MWNDAPLLSTIGVYAIWVSAVAALIATAAGLLGGISANRANDLTTKASNERIATADARAQEAKLETARLWSQMAWRRLSPAQATALKSALEGETFDLWVTCVGSDPDTMLYWQEIHAALGETGLKVNGFTGYQRAVGITVAGPDSPQKEKLVSAFRAAGLAVQTTDRANMGKGLEVIVGTKAEPARPQLTPER